MTRTKLTDMSDLDFWTAQAAKSQAKLDELDRQRAAIFNQHVANTHRLSLVGAK